VLLVGREALFREFRLALQCDLGKRDGGFTVGNHVSRLGDLLRPGAVDEPREYSSLGGYACAGKPHVVSKVGLVEHGHDLPSVDPITLVDPHLGDPASHLEAQIELADVDIALQDHDATVSRTKEK
jgi:hypothetical protein